MEIEQYERYEAVFRPQQTDDLRPAALALIGRNGVFEALSIIEHGKYEGQWQMQIPDEWYEEIAESGEPFVWVPSGDLEIKRCLNRFSRE